MIMTTENQKNQNIIKSKELTSELKVNLLITKNQFPFCILTISSKKKYFENSTYASIKQTKETLTKVYKPSMQK